jgi:hypothetical protein
MTHFYAANGYVPRTHGEAQGRRHLQDWLQQQVEGGFFNGRQPMAPSPWTWDERCEPTTSVVPGGDSRPIIRSMRQTLYNVMEIPLHAESGGFSKGYVTCRDVAQAREPERVSRGQPGGPLNPDEPVRWEQYAFWDVVRVFPNDEEEAAGWGYVYENPTQWQVILRECQRYNRTLHDRVIA